MDKMEKGGKKQVKSQLLGDINRAIPDSDRVAGLSAGPRNLRDWRVDRDVYFLTVTGEQK